MAKKKKKNAKHARHRADKKAKKQQKRLLNQNASSAVAIPSESTKTLVPLGKKAEKTETTFSKKLEEAISENVGKAKKGLLRGKIILLGPPSGYGERDWSEVWKRFLRITKLFLVVLLIIGLVSSAVVVLEVVANNHVFPRIAFAEQDLGYQDLSQARNTIIQKLKDYQGSELTFVYGEKSVKIPVKDLAMSFQADQTLASLPYFSFPQNNLIDLVKANFTDQTILPAFKKDDQKIFNLVERRLDLLDQRARAAHFIIDDHKKLQIQPEKSGIIINKAALIDEIRSNIEHLNNNTPIQVRTLQEIPAVNASELAKFQPDIQVKLENQINLKYGNSTWKFKPTNHLENIDFRKDNDQVTIIVSPQIIDDFLAKEVFSHIEKPVSHVKITTDDKGKVDFQGHIQNGLSVNKPQFLSDLNMAINSLDQDVTIQVDETKATLDIDKRLQDMGIKELIGVGHTAFAGSPTNRRANITVGMSKFNGVMIKPGETFSFDDTLGPVDASTGYKLELVIKAEGTVPDYGGGICQVSSTMFKAALFTGLPIVERAPHSYAVGYYAQVDGYGLDSTIYPGVRDLKFTNNTPGNILIQTYIDGDDAYINFFGTSDGRQVKMENYWRGNFRGAGGTELIPTNTLPAGARKQIEAAHGGFDASWDRTITTKDGKSATEKIYSVYRATSNRFLVGQ